MDAAGNLGPASNTATAVTAVGGGLVAAYSFDEGVGHDRRRTRSGNGNNGTLVNATWTTAGKYGGALSFNGSNARVNVPSSSSLQLTSGMTLEAWVNPSSVSSAWRDVIYKGNDNYYLEGDLAAAAATPPAAAPSAARTANVFGVGRAPREHVDAPRPHLRRRRRCASTSTALSSSSQAQTGAIATSTNQLSDRRRQHLRPVLRRA